MSDFYIGYLPQAPVATARFIKRIVAGLAVVALVAAMTLVLSQMPFARSIFEFGTSRNFEGVVATSPYPMLLVPRPGSHEVSQYLLVAPGKHGADSFVAAFAGKNVRLQGQLIYRDGQTMVEIDPKTITVMDSPHNSGPETIDLGATTLTGEIVDSKCYLGVMNPGRGKVRSRGALSEWRYSTGFADVHGRNCLLVNRDGKAFASRRRPACPGCPLITTWA